MISPIALCELDGELARLPADEFVEQYGMKAWGLSRLPRAWLPPTFLVPSTIFEFLSSEKKEPKLVDYFQNLEKGLSDFLNKNGYANGVILRSSASQETILDRGRYLSVQLTDVTKEGLRQAFQEIGANFAEQGASGQMAIVIQPFLQSKASGHLANYRRVSKTRNGWYAEINSGDPKFTESSLSSRSERFNSQRDAPPGELVHLPGAANSVSLLDCLKGIGCWLASNLDPVVSVEWVLTDNEIWLVQCDDEIDPPDAVDPKKLEFKRPDKSGADTVPAPFERYAVGSGSRLRKLAALDDFMIPDAQSLPEMFYTSAQNLAATLSSHNQRQEFVAGLNLFAPSGVVIRTDHLNASGTAGMNLPKTDTVVGDVAAEWLASQIQSIEDNGSCLADHFFLMHRFIPARASAWSFASPAERYVRVDSLWGIPDGIQFFPHDSFEYDTLEQKVVRPTIDFKPFFTWPTEAGEWQNHRVKSARARSQSVSNADVSYIAEYTKKVATKLGEPAQIMWFCDFPEWGSFKKPLPWYRERHSRRPRTLNAAPELPQVVLRTIEDIDAIIGNKKLAPSKLILEPDSALIRSPDFIQSVAKAANAGRHSVVLNGSVLAHAFHQLLDLGVRIFSSRSPIRRRAIGKQDFGKLVRDKIPDRIMAHGDAVTFGRVPKTEKRRLLISKAFEELAELAAAEEDSRVEEMADLYEVLTAILADFAISWDDVVKAADAKRESRGGFSEGFVLVGTNLPKPDETDLLPNSEINRVEVKASQALRSALKIDSIDGETTIPFLNLLSSEEGVKVPVGARKNGVSVSIKFHGDRMVVSVSSGSTSGRKPPRTETSSGSLPFGE